MSETLWAAFFSVLGSLIGTLGGILASARLMNYRIDQLEHRIKELEQLVKRVFDLEKKSAVYEERFRSGVYQRKQPEQRPN